VTVITCWTISKKVFTNAHKSKRVTIAELRAEQELENFGVTGV
jgi:hypothetical protein